jgi:putative drug exporter of the RND superfamily
MVALAIVGVARSVGQETSDNLSLPGTDSQAASNLLGDKFFDQANGSVPIAFRAPPGTKLSDIKYKKPIERVTKAYGKDPALAQAVGHLTSRAVTSSTRSIRSATSPST